MTTPKITAPPFRVFSDFLTLGHSLAGSYGASIDEFGWPARVASALGGELQDRHVDGAVAALDDINNSGDGGWATAASYLDPQNVTPPWAARNPLTSIYLGHNDDVFSGQTTIGRQAMRAAMRGAIGHARSAARFNDNDATVRTTGTSETGSGSWVRGTPAALQYAMNAQFTYTTAVNDEIHIDVPAGPPINAIWIYTLTGGGVSTTLNGGVTAGATSVVLTSAASFPTAGTAKVIDTSIFPPNGPEDFFTWTGKSTNTLTGVSGIQTHLTGLTVVNAQGEGALFTVDVDGTPSTAPPDRGFDTRDLGFQVSPARITGHGWRIPIPADGLAHEVTIKVTNLQSVFYFDGWEIEATTPPVVVLPLPVRGYWYELYTGYQYPPSDSTITALRAQITALAAEFDKYVITVDADTALNKEFRNYYQPTGTTTTTTLSAGATTVAVAELSTFPAAGNATIIDGGTPDTFTYTGKSASSGAGNLTGISTTGPLAIISHGSSGLKVAPTDGMHLSDEGHEIFATSFLNDLQRKMPRDQRSVVASQRHRGSYGNRDQWKEPVRAASPGINVSIASPPTTLDGVTLARNDRLLLKDQTVPSENGIYRYFGGAPPLIRDSDANGNGKLRDGTTVSVCEGIANADTDWTQTTGNPIVIGTTTTRWTRIYPPPGSSTAHRSPWNPTPTVGGGTLTQLRQLSIERNGGLTNVAAPATSVIRATGGFVIPAGATVTNLAFASGSTSPISITNQWASICDLNRVVKGVSTDRTSEAWATFVWKQFPLVTPWTADVDTPVMLTLSTTAGTSPTMSGVLQSNLSQQWTPLMGATGAAVATPPANGSTLAALTAVTGIILCGWS